MPTKIKKVRKIEKEKDVKTGVDKIKKINEFFSLQRKGLGSTGDQTKVFRFIQTLSPMSHLV